MVLDCCSLTCVAYIAAPIAAIWFAMKARVVPKKLCIAWFAAVLIVNVLLTGLLTLLCDKLRVLGVPRRVTQVLCTYACSFTFGCVLFFNPQIKISIDESRVKWAQIPVRSAMALNHVSFLDAFLFVGSAPLAYIYNCRTMMKDSLRKIPIFGGVFDRVGHFPVYFKSDEDGNFSLDKERQAPVMERVNKHLEENGRIALFPEGAVNKKPKEGLQMFRLGSFNIVLEKKLPLFYMCMVGNYDTWPHNAAVGGAPADIEVFINKFEIDYAKDDAKSVAERLQKVMQADIDRLEAKRKAAK